MLKGSLFFYLHTGEGNVGPGEIERYCKNLPKR